MNPLLLTTLLCVAYPATAPPVSIVWQPMVNSQFQFKWQASTDDYPGPNGVADLKQEETDTDTIKASDGGNILVEVHVTDIKASLGDQTVQSKVGSAGILRHILYKKDGTLVSWHSDDLQDVENPRFDGIERFIYPDHPVSQGDTWTYKQGADKAKGIQDNQSTYAYEGRETVKGVPANKVAVHFKETGTLISVEAHGAFWLSVSDGELVKKDITVDNLTVGNGARPFKLRITEERMP